MMKAFRRHVDRCNDLVHRGLRLGDRGTRPVLLYVRHDAHHLRLGLEADCAGPIGSRHLLEQQRSSGTCCQSYAPTKPRSSGGFMYLPRAGSQADHQPMTGQDRRRRV